MEHRNHESSSGDSIPVEQHADAASGISAAIDGEDDDMMMSKGATKLFVGQVAIKFTL